MSQGDLQQDRDRDRDQGLGQGNRDADAGWARHWSLGTWQRCGVGLQPRRLYIPTYLGT